MTVLGLDIGFGDTKVVYGDKSGIIQKLYKFNSVLGKVDVSEHVNDKRTYKYLGNDYYVGDLALNLESSKVIDVLTYKNLEKYAPLITKYVIDNLSEVPETIVMGLSIAHISNSGYFREGVKKYIIEELGYSVKSVVILPQGAGTKYTMDKYGLNFPILTENFVDNSNYLIADLGFNTADILQVLNNKTSGNMIRGIENQGIVKIVNKLADQINFQYDTEFSIKETKEILDRGFFKLRGKNHNLKDQINVVKNEYLEEIKELIEKEFGKILNKMDELRIVGGASYLFNNTSDDFVKTPKTRSEYYNAIGFYTHGTTLSN